MHWICSTGTRPPQRSWQPNNANFQEAPTSYRNSLSPHFTGAAPPRVKPHSPSILCLTSRYKLIIHSPVALLNRLDVTDQTKQIVTVLGTHLGCKSVHRFAVCQLLVVTHRVRLFSTRHPFTIAQRPWSHCEKLRNCATYSCGGISRRKVCALV